MLLEILLATFVGILIGSLTGIIPGLHVNLISIILLSISGYLLGFLNPLTLSVFIVSIAVTHTFVNVIPGIFLGAPDEACALAILPAHKMLLDGLGYNAVKLTVIGSLFSLIAVILIIPILIPILPFIFKFLQPYIGWILIIISIFMIFKEETLNKKFWGFFVFMLAGILGTIALTTPTLNQPLLPMLSGLFGVSLLVFSLKNISAVPKQRDISIDLPKKETVKAISAATLSGSITGIFPALGSAQAAIIAMVFVGELKPYPYLVLIGGINTANFVFSLATFYAIDKARNGAVVALGELIKIDVNTLIILLAVGLITGAFATFATLFLGKIFAGISSKINYRLLSIIVIAFIASLVLYFSSWIGILILITSTAIGIIPNVIGIKRSLSMGCLILPVILFYL